jgi:hypothetical protein
MENFGYLLSEAPVFVLVVWFAVKLVQFRRYRRNQPVFSETDHQLLFGRVKPDLSSPVFRLRMARAILAVTAAIYLEILVFAPLGAGILAGALIATSAAIVHQVLMLDA